MSTTNYASGIALENLQPQASQNEEGLSEQPATAPVSRPLRALFFGFAATIGLGLALASWYLGDRIVKADQIATKPVPALTRTNTIPASMAPPSDAQEDSIAEAYWQTVPAPVHSYLEVAGFGTDRDQEFAKSLQLKGLHVQVQVRGGASRILIGPFSSNQEMEQAQRKLASTGIVATATTY